MPPPGRGKYLAFVAHEIKNPLATALWSADLLKRMDATERGGERAQKMIDVELRALRRMRRLIDDYFTIERLNEHAYDLRREPVAWKDLVEPALHLLTEKDGIPAAGFAVALGAGTVMGDIEMMRRAVRLTAEHLTRAVPPPKVTITSEGPVLLLRADPAPVPLVPPIPEERQSGDPTGAVLGYALAARILEAHGGRLEERDGALALVVT